MDRDRERGLRGAETGHVNRHVLPGRDRDIDGHCPAGRERGAGAKPHRLDCSPRASPPAGFISLCYDHCIVYSTCFEACCSVQVNPTIAAKIAITELPNSNSFRTDLNPIAPKAGQGPMA
jgi:hypothetical protein